MSKREFVRELENWSDVKELITEEIISIAELELKFSTQRLLLTSFSIKMTSLPFNPLYQIYYIL